MLKLEFLHDSNEAEFDNTHTNPSRDKKDNNIKSGTETLVKKLRSLKIKQIIPNECLCYGYGDRFIRGNR